MQFNYPDGLEGLTATLVVLHACTALKLITYQVDFLTFPVVFS